MTCPKSRTQLPFTGVILVSWKIEQSSLHRDHPCGGFSIGGNMGYRKVGYAEQVWYIIKYKLQELLRRKK